ncbi:ankyrin repeat domain-containing protein [Nocardia niigatensis]
MLAQDRRRLGKLIAAGVEVDGRDTAARTPLYLAVCRPDTEIIRMLVAAGADPNARSGFGDTPFYRALNSDTGCAETVALLRAHGADARLMVDIHRTDEYDRVPLHYAAFHDDLPLQDELLSVLLVAGSDIHARDHAGFTPLHAAASGANPRAALALLEAGAEVDATDNRGDSPLLVAVNTSRAAAGMITLLRQWGADPFRKNRRGSSAIGLARENVSGGNTDQVRAALADLFDAYDAEVRRLQTPLHDAAEVGDVDAVGELLHAGADPNAVNIRGRTPVHLAAQGGHETTLRALLDVGAAVDIDDDFGSTPLSLAISAAHRCDAALGSVRLLVERGADPDNTASESGTPRGIAVANDMHGVLAIFLEIEGVS